MTYRSLIRPFLFRIPAETAHEIGLNFLSKLGNSDAIVNRVRPKLAREPFGTLTRFGITFPNPVGIAAGFDKNAIAVPSLNALGFGFIEVGTVTNLPQPGNPKPRIFRLRADRALINRAGFNNEGASAVAERLRHLKSGVIVGVNIGKSRAVELDDAIEDYLASFNKVTEVSDYVVVNVSSPNTPGLRTLQEPKTLAPLLTALQSANRLASENLGRPPVPLLVKLAPDINQAELAALAEMLLDLKINGIIASNTTVRRDNLTSPASLIEDIGPGGVSGAPLREMSTAQIAELYLLTRGEIPIIGVGGIFSAEDAWEKICAGASLVQIYTGFVYEGPAIAARINDGLLRLLNASKFSSLDEVVGSRAEFYSSQKNEHRSTT